jgi:integrase
MCYNNNNNKGCDNMAKTRGNGEGNIRQRPDGRWESRYSIKDPITGKQKQHSIYGQKQSEVSKKLKQVLSDIDNGNYVEPNKITISDWMVKWLKNYAKLEISSSTYRDYESMIKNHVIPKLGFVKIEDLKPYTLQSFYNELLEGGRVLTKGKEKNCTDLSLSVGRVRKIHAMLHKSFNQAIKAGLLKNNPDDGCVLPSKERHELNIFPEEQINSFFDEISDSNYYEVFVLEVCTGLRLGELLGIEWDSVNFNDNTIQIKQQLKIEDHKLILSPFLKTDYSFRKLAIPEFAMGILKSLKDKQDSIFGKGIVTLTFCNQDGKSYYPTTINHYFHKVQDKLGLPSLRFHDLRHSWATYALNHGTDIKTVQEILGHADAAFTMQTYTHSTMTMKKDSANKMNDFLSDKVK